MPQFISWALTLGSVILGCVFFMETNVHRLVTKLQTLVTPGAYSLHNISSAFSSFSGNGAAVLGLTLGLATLVLLLEHIAVWQKRENEYDLLTSPWVSRALLALTILLAANTPSQFIYFEF